MTSTTAHAPDPAVDVGGAEAAVRALLVALGHDPTSERLRRTPERVAAFAARAMRAGAADPVLATSARIRSPGPGPVVLDRIPFRSVCEHHLLPFGGTVSVVIAPLAWIVGLGRLTRLVEDAAARLQLQERFTDELARSIDDALEPAGTLISTTATHACLWALGEGDLGTTCTAMAATGSYRTGAGRGEALALLAAARG